MGEHAQLPLGASAPGQRSSRGLSWSPKPPREANGLTEGKEMPIGGCRLIDEEGAVLT